VVQKIKWIATLRSQRRLKKYFQVERNINKKIFIFSYIYRFDNLKIIVKNEKFQI